MDDIDDDEIELSCLAFCQIEIFGWKLNAKTVLQAAITCGRRCHSGVCCQYVTEKSQGRQDEGGSLCNLESFFQKWTWHLKLVDLYIEIVNTQYGIQVLNDLTARSAGSFTRKSRQEFRCYPTIHRSLWSLLDAGWEWEDGADHPANSNGLRDYAKRNCSFLSIGWNWFFLHLVRKRAWISHSFGLRIPSEDRQLVRMRMDYMDCSCVLHK